MKGKFKKGGTNPEPGKERTRHRKKKRGPEFWGGDLTKKLALKPGNLEPGRKRQTRKLKGQSVRPGLDSRTMGRSVPHFLRGEGEIGGGDGGEILDTKPTEMGRGRMWQSKSRSFVKSTTAYRFNKNGTGGVSSAEKGTTTKVLGWLIKAEPPRNRGRSGTPRGGAR